MLSIRSAALFTNSDGGELPSARPSVAAVDAASFVEVNRQNKKHKAKAKQLSSHANDSAPARSSAIVSPMSPDNTAKGAAPGRKAPTAVATKETANWQSNRRPSNSAAQNIDTIDAQQQPLPSLSYNVTNLGPRGRPLPTAKMPVLGDFLPIDKSRYASGFVRTHFSVTDLVNYAECATVNTARAQLNRQQQH